MQNRTQNIKVEILKRQLNLGKKLKIKLKVLKNLLLKIERLQQTLKEETVEKPKITSVKYGKDEMDKYLNNKESVDLLNFYGLKLPSKYKGKSLEEFQEAFDGGLNITAEYKKNIKDVAKYKKDSLTGMVLAFPKAKENAKEKTKKLFFFPLFISIV